ncbi:MAG: CBS domain-containing protein [Thermodesulfovibrionales bacterium]|nr:CBS domain-containing protein [Thermodesulfovibrionales bacterium]
MKAKDLMIPLQEYLTPDHTLKEAANFLRIAGRGEEKIGVKALPVLDTKGKLIGILSIGDILKAVYPKYMYQMDLGSFTWDGMVETIAKKMADRKVKDFMTQMVITIREDAPIMECVDQMLKHNVKRVPVLNKENKVIGILYERDIFFFITNAMQNSVEVQNDE